MRLHRPAWDRPSSLAARAARRRARLSLFFRRSELLAFSGRAVTFFHRFLLTHILTLFRFAVIARAFPVKHFRLRIHPDHSMATARHWRNVGQRTHLLLRRLRIGGNRRRRRRLVEEVSQNVGSRRSRSYGRWRWRRRRHRLGRRGCSFLVRPTLARGGRGRRRGTTARSRGGLRCSRGLRLFVGPTLGRRW